MPSSRGRVGALTRIELEEGVRNVQVANLADSLRHFRVHFRFRPGSMLAKEATAKDRLISSGCVRGFAFRLLLGCLVGFAAS